MAEPLGLVTSVIAVVQLADLIAETCKSYIGTVRDYPRDLRTILVEVSSLGVVFEGLRLLEEDDPGDSAVLECLQRPDGPIEGCKRSLADLEKLFSPASPKEIGGKRKRVQLTLKALA